MVKDIIKRLTSEPLLFGLAIVILLIGGATTLSELGTANFRLMIAVITFIFFVAIIAYLLRTSNGKTDALMMSGYVYFDNHLPVRNARVYGTGIEKEAYTDDIGAYKAEVANPQEKMNFIAEFENLTDVKKDVTKEQLAKSIDFSIPLVAVEISGTVVNQDGSRLAGVNVTVDGTPESATSDQNGFFKLSVPKWPVWKVRYGLQSGKGMEREIAPDDLTNLKLELEQGAEPDEPSLVDRDGPVMLQEDSAGAEQEQPKEADGYMSQKNSPDAKQKIT